MLEKNIQLGFASFNCFTFVLLSIYLYDISAEVSCKFTAGQKQSMPSFVKAIRSSYVAERPREASCH